MAAGVDAIQNAISPGSTAYGERGALEEAISVGGASGGMAPAAGAAAAPVSMGPLDPLTALMDGTVESNPEVPVTDGLSVGPGAQPFADDSADPLKARLIAVAEGAESPRLRAAALTLLRQHVRRGMR